MTVVSLENLLYGEELRALQEHHRFLRDEDGITEYRSIAEVGDTECRSLLKGQVTSADLFASCGNVSARGEYRGTDWLPQTKY